MRQVPRNRGKIDRLKCVMTRECSLGDDDDDDDDDDDEVDMSVNPTRI